MLLSYKNKQIKLDECTSFYSRLKGFMFEKNINRALLFNNCNSIHTFFMKQNIDVIMCDKDNNILFYYPNLKKGRVILPKRNVKNVIETPPNYFNITVGKKINIEKEE